MSSIPALDSKESNSVEIGRVTTVLKIKQDEIEEEIE